DESGSGYGFRFMQDCRNAGLSEQQACEQILADQTEAGEWARRVDKRQLHRAWENSKSKEQPDADEFDQRFKLTAFKDVKIGTTTNYLVKGIVPREGLIVVWGPPKCGKSFWTFDLSMHVALDWKYRGCRVKQGRVVYLALEGRGGFAGRIEAFKKFHDLKDM